MNETDILNILKESAHKIRVDFEASYVNITAKCNLVECDLKRLLYIKEFREKEKRENLKRKKGEKIIKISNEMLLATNFPPMSEFTDHAELNILNDILHCKLLIDNIEENILFYILCAMVIKKIIKIVSSSECFSDYPPTALIIQIDKVLIDLMITTEDLKKKIYERERIGDRQSKSASTKTTIRLTGIKNSPIYPKLVKILNDFTGAWSEKEKIDEVLKKIFKTKNKKTIRKYRQYLLEHFDHEKQDVI